MKFAYEDLRDKQFESLIVFTKSYFACAAIAFQ